SALAAYLGALIAWAALAGGDRIGGVVFGNDARAELRPRHTRATAMAWLQHLHDFNHRLHADTRAPDTAGATLAGALADLRRGARPGTAVILISDFAGADDARVREQLQRLAQHCALVALRLFDPLEAELPPPALYTFTDSGFSGASARLTLDTGDRQLRQL